MQKQQTQTHPYREIHLGIFWIRGSKVLWGANRGLGRVFCVCVCLWGWRQWLQLVLGMVIVFCCCLSVCVCFCAAFFFFCSCHFFRFLTEISIMVMNIKINGTVFVFIVYLFLFFFEFIMTLGVKNCWYAIGHFESLWYQLKRRRKKNRMKRSRNNIQLNSWGKSKAQQVSNSGVDTFL